jgi:hypothetical protein
MADLDANWNIRKNSKIDFCAFDDLYFSLYDFLSCSKLFRAEADTHALDTDSPFTIGECGAFG